MSEQEGQIRPERVNAPGPLTVSTVNPRYFVVASGTADEQIVYLTDSHINNNFHDGLGFGPNCPEEPERFDYDEYLAFLKEHGHNFIRLWRWEQFKGRLPTVGVHLCMTPQPWARTGPGLATDGKPKFDLEQFDQEYFDRLRSRVAAAGNQGIYVSVMLFEGFSLHLTAAPDNIEGHPFHSSNNVNGIAIHSIDDYQVLPLDLRVQAIQEEYMRKVLDTVGDLPNVLYEVANESSGGGSVDQSFAEVLGLEEATAWGDSAEWQYWVIEFVRAYEKQRSYRQHPVRMTMQFPVPDGSAVNAPLFNGPADWVSPGTGGGPNDTPLPGHDWLQDPPANDGRKVVINDTDHYAPGGGDELWAWKSFLRGHNPILYDLGIVSGAKPAVQSTETPPYAAFEPGRYAMGDTLRYARKVSLAQMAPRGDLSATRYALANPGDEYLVLQPDEAADSFSVNVESGTYVVEWFSIRGRATERADTLTVDSSEAISFKPQVAPAGPVVLYLKRVGP